MSGGVGVFLWLVIYTMGAMGILLGIISIAETRRKEKNQVVLSFRLLIITLLIYLFIGSLMAIRSIIIANEALGQSGAAKAYSIAIGISNCLYATAFTLISATPYIVFIAVSIIISHYKQPPLSREVQ